MKAEMMDVIYRLVMWLIKVYRFIQLFIIRFLLYDKLKAVIMRKLTEMGITMIDGNGIVLNSKFQRQLQKNDNDNDKRLVMKIYDERKFFERLLNERSLGLGESYMEGVWESQDIVEIFSKITQYEFINFALLPIERTSHYFQYWLFNLQTVERAYQVAQEHYDLGDELFESFLDPSMNYSCAYWSGGAKNLEEAQQHKMELIAKKLKLKPGMRVLDIGCGWGGLCEYLAKNYKVSVVGCNIAKAGAKAAEKRCKGLSVEIRCCDYREINEKFDRVVTVGFMEHVGPFNYETFFEVASRCLDDAGILLIQTIGLDSHRGWRIEPWFSTYIFPNGALPRATDITKHISGKFTLEDWHSLGNDYSRTCLAWYEKFVENWPTIRHLFREPEKFYRMWTYYLQICSGGFKSRKIHLWQITLAKNCGVPGGYVSVR